MKISRKELQRVIREEKVRLRREDTRSASRKSGSNSGGAGKKSRANRLRRLDEQPTQHPGNVEDVAAAQEEIEVILNELFDAGVDNAGMVALLQNIIKDIEDGSFFFGPST